MVEAVVFPTEKLVPLVVVPPAVVTLILPVVAPVGTLVTIVVLELAVKFAFTPLNVTFVAVLKFEPVMVTVVPTLPDVGVKLEMAGAGTTVDGGTTVNELLLVALPPGVVTEMVPLVAPDGTVALICVPETTLKNEALVPLNATAEAPVKFVPVMVTAVPTTPDPGENP